MKSKKKPITIAIFILVGFCLSLLSLKTPVAFKDFQLIHPNGHIESVHFPLIVKSPEASGIYQLEGTLHKSFFSPNHYKIIADDALLELHINGKNISLENIPMSLRGNYQKGFHIDLSSSLQAGKNKISFTFQDHGGMMGVQMKATAQDTRLMLLFFAWALFFLSLLWIFRKKLNLPVPYLIIFILAILIRIVYLSSTDFNTRGHDTYEHLEYTEHFVKNWALPELNLAIDGAYFHPPFYYFSSAVVYTIASWLNHNNTSFIYFSLQIFSLLASIGFVFFGIQTILLLFESYPSKKRTFLEDFLTWLSCFLFAFWPSAIIHSPRIGNDPLLYFFFAAALYFITRWFIKGGPKFFVYSSVCISLAILTKMNGAILIGVLLPILAIKWITGASTLSKSNIKTGFLSLILMFGALGFAMYPSLRLSLSGERDHLYVDNIENVSSGLRVGNHLENFLWLDIKTFVTKPYTSPWEDEFGRQYFLNYQGKTGLVGEWQYSSTIAYNAAIAMSFIALYMLAIALFGLFKISLKNLYRGLPVILTALFLWASVCYMRYTFPVNIDFRYILPIIIPFCVAFHYGLLELASKKSKRQLAISIVLSIAFITSSTIFMFNVS